MNSLTISLIALVLSNLNILVEAKEKNEAGHHVRGHIGGKVGNSKLFPYKPYKEFQISDGVAGKCEENAKAVFVDPFKNVNLQDLTEIDLNNLFNMTAEAIQNEIYFTEAMEKNQNKKSERNPKSLFNQLRLGRTANKCLKIIGAIQVITIQQKMNLSPVNGEERLKELHTKLQKNIRNDQKAAGRKMISYLSLGKNSNAKETEDPKDKHQKGKNSNEKEQEDNKGKGGGSTVT